MKKKPVSISLNDKQRELLEFAIEEQYPGADVSYSAFIWNMIEDRVRGALDIPDFVELTVDELYEEVDEYYVKKQIDLINFIGIEKYENYIKEREDKGTELSPVVYEALKRYKKGAN